MKLVTIDSREVTGRPGVCLDEDWIVDLSAAPRTLEEAQWRPASVVSILAAGSEGPGRVSRLLDIVAASDPEQKRALRDDGILLPARSTALMSPLRRPGLILVVSIDQPVGGEPAPVTYIKSPNTAAGHGATIDVPWSTDAPVAVTGLLGVVLGRPLYRATEDEADRAVAGYTLMMDVSLPLPEPEASASAWRRYIHSKQFPGASPMGPAVITRDEIERPEQLSAAASVNDVVTREGPIYGRRRPIPGLVAALSRDFGFRPGDVVAIEPPGDGGFGPQVLKNADHFCVSLGGHMTLMAEFRF